MSPAGQACARHNQDQARAASARLLKEDEAAGGSRARSGGGGLGWQQLWEVDF